MGYQIGKVTQVRRKVEFELPCDDGDQPEKADFEVTLKVLDATVTKERLETLRETATSFAKEVRKVIENPDFQPTSDPAALEEQFLREDVVSIAGILDKAENELPYTPALLDSVLNDIAARQALVRVWKETGQEGAVRRKN